MNKRTSLSRLDEQVILTMIIICLLGLIIVGFRYAARTPCGPVHIILNTTNAQVDHTVTVRAEATNARSFEWDLGDGSIVNETSAMIAHVYKQPGRYTIKVLVNGSCEEFRDITITEAPEVINVYRLPTFICRDTAYVNKPVSFEDTASNVSTWEWRFEEGGQPGENRRKVQHTYYYPGQKLVTLKPNGRSDLITFKYIYVIDPSAERKDEAIAKEKPAKERGEPKVVVIPSKPETTPMQAPTPAAEPAPPPKPKPKPDVSTDVLAGMLKGINEGNNEESDVSGFFCNPNMAVVYEGKTMLFSDACKKLKEIKKGKIKRVTVTISKEAETNCISNMTIDVKKKLIDF